MPANHHWGLVEMMKISVLFGLLSLEMEPFFPMIRCEIDKLPAWTCATTTRFAFNSRIGKKKLTSIHQKNTSPFPRFHMFLPQKSVKTLWNPNLISGLHPGNRSSPGSVLSCRIFRLRWKALGGTCGFGGVLEICFFQWVHPPMSWWWFNWT